MQTHFFIDLHCHPTIKAYARSYQNGTPGIQSGNIRNRSSIWHQDTPSFIDKLKNYIAGLTNFIQSDATSLFNGKVCVACLSFYPQEKGFFINRSGQGIISDTLTKLATEFGQQRIDHIQKMDSYWLDLQTEMNFLRQQENKPMLINGQKITYSIASSFADIEHAIELNEIAEKCIIFVPTIEGAHVFDQQMDCYEPWDKYPEGIPVSRLEKTIQRIYELRESKNGLIRPAFITFAHHFWNGLCGHARSLGGLVKCFVDQENGIVSHLNDSGKKAIAAMLGSHKDENGIETPPIYIDIKHMNRQSRLDYFALLNTNDYAGKKIPVFVSHGGVTGLSAPNGVNQTPISQKLVFMEEGINFYDDELLQIEKTNGIFAIQLDERRIASKATLRKTRGNLGRRNILFAWAGLVWNQVRHIAELLDMNNRYAWSTQTLGTDFDGIIDPINGYWTAADMDDLDDFLLMHAFNYINGIKEPCPLQLSQNRNIKAEEIVDKVMTGNALRFLSMIY